MANWFAGLDSREKSQLFNSFRQKSKEKMGVSDDSKEEQAVLDLLKGEPSGSRAAFKDFYDNIVLPAWKSFVPKYASKTPCPSVRALMPHRVALAEAFQALFRYRVGAFDYRSLVSAACMDVWAFRAGIGYVRHQWDEKKGLTGTSRISPKDVFWDHSASSIGKASHVIERHVLKRGEFIKKFGKEKGWNADATKDSAIDWPKRRTEHEGKTLFDEIEYFLMWSREGGVKRVYAFTEKQDDEILNGAGGEPWPIDLGDDWHLTDLRLTKLPGKIDGVSPIWAAEGQHDAYQRINAAVYFSNLKAGKSFLFYPDEMNNQMILIEKAFRTFNPVPYSPQDLGGMKLSEAIEKWEMPPTPETLLTARMEALNKWRGTMSLNAVQMMEAQNLETATEAQSLQSSAANLVADDQGAVEAFTNEIFRKEAVCDASKTPKLSVVCVKPPGLEKDEHEGEFEDEAAEKASDPDNPEDYRENVPYEDAVLLEKGVVSIAATKRIAKAREKKGAELEFNAVMSGTADPQQAREQGQQMIPQTPEMEVRVKYDVPMDAVCKIESPGVEQFIGALSAGWIEGLTPGQVEAELGISIEPGSSSPTQRMQDVNEVLMLYSAVSPVFIQYGLYSQLADLINAAIKRSQISDLDKVQVKPEEIQQAVQQQQQAAMEQAQAEAAGKNQPQGPVEVDPNVAIKADAEKHKTDVGLETQKEKTIQQGMKLEGDQARDRTKSLSQLQMGGVA